MLSRAKNTVFSQKVINEWDNMDNDDVIECETVTQFKNKIAIHEG